MKRIGRAGSRALSAVRALCRRLLELIVALARGVRAGLRAESRRRRRLWIVVAALLVLVPFAFNIARAPSFKSSQTLFPRAVKPYPAIFDLGYYRTLLDDPELRFQMRQNAGPGTASYDDVTFRRGPKRRTLTMTVEADTPANAQRFLNALGPQLAGATQRGLAQTADADTEDTRARLRTRLTRDERQRLRRRLRRLEDFGPFPPARVLPGGPQPPPRITRWADRLVDRLPGDFSQRPSPVWAALAGALVAITLWAICLVLVPPRGASSEDPLPQPD